VPLATAFDAPGGFLARCVALEEPQILPGPGAQRVVQRFRILWLIIGSTRGEAVVRIEYHCRDGERAVRESEVVLWFAALPANQTWRGTKALLDTDENNSDAWRAADDAYEKHRPRSVHVEVEYPTRLYALGDPMPIELKLRRVTRDTIAIYPDPGELEFFADDEWPLKRPASSARVPTKPTAALLGQAHAIDFVEDIADQCDWLAGHNTRAFTVVWRGAVRVGDPSASPVEIVSARPVMFAIRDPASLAWGVPSEGLACGLAALRDSLVQGDRLAVHLGLRFDPTTAPESLGMLNDFSREARFLFTNTLTGESIERGPTVFVGPGPPSAWPDDFVNLRDRPVTLRTIDISLLTPEGKQLPEGIYSVTCWYENEGEAKVMQDECSYPTPYVGSLTFWKGTITSAPILVHVGHAKPVQRALRVNSGLEVDGAGGRVVWRQTQENPFRIMVMQRPGYFLGRTDVESVAIGRDAIKWNSERAGPIWVTRNDPGGALRLDDNARVAAGERLLVRSDITIFETSEPPGHLWMPEAGDYRVLWQGRIEGKLPGRGYARRIP
jgi:hypothetical protein